jgi:hypothetical protein
MRRGFALVRVNFRGKDPGAGWETLKITKKNVAQHLAGNCNVGVLLGAPSRGLCDVDNDSAEAVALGDEFLPATSMVSGRATKPRSHRFYTSDLHESETVATLPYQDVDGSMICELRIGGGGKAAQTVIPPSVHESGEPIMWYEQGKPAHVPGAELKRAVAKRAAAALLAHHWPNQGGRHQAALVLDGFLARLEWSRAERQQFIVATATVAGDNELRDRQLVGKRTEQKLASDQPVPGFPALCKLFGTEVARKAARWLEYPGWELEEVLARMNAEYCVIKDGGKVRVLQFDVHEQVKGGQVIHRRRFPIYFGFGDFHNFHKNEKVRIEDELVPVGNWWTGHPQRRTYKGLTFRPDLKDEVVNGRLNLWRGWGVVPKAGDWSLMQRHIKEVIAAGDAEHDTYITNWLSWSVQNPADPAEVAIMLQGGRGTGKGTLGNAMMYIFGQHAVHISSVRHLVGHFNAHLRDACFLFADEAYWPGDKSGEGTLKRLITEPTLTIEPKFVDPITVPNMLHVLITSNEDRIIPAGEGERRYAAFKISEHKRQDESWFKPLYKQLSSGGYAAMLSDLLHRELGDWHPRKIPMTEALREQQIQSLRPLDAWVLEFVEVGVLPAAEGVDRPSRAVSHTEPDFDLRNPRNGLFDLARERHHQLRYVDDQVLADHLKKVWGCEPWRSSAKRGWEFPPLAKCRAAWEKRYPGWQWRHPEMTEWQQEENQPTGKY